MHLSFGNKVESENVIEVINNEVTLFHLVNSTSDLSIPSIPFLLTLFSYYFLPWVGTPSTYSEYLLEIPTPE